MNNSLIKFFLIAIPFGLIILSGCNQSDSNKISELEHNVIAEEQEPTWTQDKEDIKATVERLLTAVGNYDLEAMDEMISDKANLGIGRFREGTWKTSTMTIDEYFEAAKNRDLLPFYEPVSEYIIHVNEGQIAFVWADATLYRYGIPRSHNIDNFTLLKEDGNWKFLNLSFTTNPLPPEQMKFDLEIFAKSYSQAWSGKRPEFVSFYFAEDGSLRVNDGEPAIGREEITKVAKGFMTDLPDMVVSFDSLVNKSNGVEFHWTLTATNSGPGGTGNKIKVSGFELWQIGEDGLINESQGNFPTEEYNRQIEFGIDN